MTARKMKTPASKPAGTKTDPVSRARALLKDGGSTPAGAHDRRALEAYASWLFYERRILCQQLWPHLGAHSSRFVMGGNAGFDWHLDGWSVPAHAYRRDPTSRAASILDLAGVDWRAKRRQDLDLIDIPDTGERPPLPEGWPAADAEIEELARRTIEAVDTWDALCEQEDDHPGLQAAVDNENTLVAALAETKPLTIAGLLAKARAAERIGGDITAGIRGRLFFSLGKDIMRLAVPLEALKPEPDPIFAAIEASRAQATADNDYDEYRRTWKALKATKPTTPAGALALVVYMREHKQRLGEWHMEEGAVQALDIAASAAALFVPAGGEG